ncbi:dual specificity tyrosine-phosphorylation-regulated kinase mbk-2 isoform X1 [Dendrobium catenatum]|uniref:Serine/threonine-protein kinase AFC2 n=3 Tax=Dendrobium catenatum TaxID=906689 RepID=A0A2I0VP97_9ASPA|nr:dual specificity tyrosine-phosphorylation-regulated kinase mbk-2 isoform X1 [Dendrobium catenatum]PKU65236.1 Serine/threonine-protein kinase AFC2 [Dendrobium catenatum]
MEEPQVHAVLNFLTRHGFSTVASALRDDALSRGLDLTSDDDSIPTLPPLRTSPMLVGVSGSTSLSSSGDFVSIGSSPSERRNPYGISSPESSARNSEFGTAREYNEPTLFGEAGWYGDQLGGYFNDPYRLPASQSEDKFVMSIEAEERFLKQEDNNFDYIVKQESCLALDSGGLYGCSFPLCDCCKGNGGERASSWKPSSSIYGRYHIMDDETERLDDCDEDESQLKLVDECTGAITWRRESGDLDQGNEDKALEPISGEKSIQKLSVDEISNFVFTDCIPVFMQNKGASLDHFSEQGFSKNTNSEVIGKTDFDGKSFDWKPSELEANDGYDWGNFDGDYKESESVGAGGENDNISDDIQLVTGHEDEFETFDLRIIHRKNRTGFEENKDFQIVLNSVVAGRYYLTEYLGSAAFSKVVQAHDLHTGTDVCLKIIKNDKEFFDQSLDEIKLLKYVNKNDPADQRHLLRLYDYFYYKEHLFIVCELLRANLFEFQKFNQDSGGDIYFTLRRIQAITRQCLEALEFLHHLKIIHCDLKPENILIKSYSRCEVKVIDLGSSCFLTDNLCLYVQSRSYRAPEVILGLPYDEKIDMWSLGCILAELYTGDVLFLNDSPTMMLARMIGIFGPFDIDMLDNGQEAHKYFTEDYDMYYKNEETDKIEYLIPEKSSLAYQLQVNDAAFLDFLGHLLQLNPKRRLTASQALKHRWLSISYD